MGENILFSWCRQQHVWEDYAWSSHSRRILVGRKIRHEIGICLICSAQILPLWKSTLRSYCVNGRAVCRLKKSETEVHFTVPKVIVEITLCKRPCYTWIQENNTYITCQYIASLLGNGRWWIFQETRTYT